MSMDLVLKVLGEIYSERYGMKIIIKEVTEDEEHQDRLQRPAG